MQHHNLRSSISHRRWQFRSLPAEGDSHPIRITELNYAGNDVGEPVVLVLTEKEHMAVMDWRAYRDLMESQGLPVIDRQSITDWALREARLMEGSGQVRPVAPGRVRKAS